MWYNRLMFRVTLLMALILFTMGICAKPIKPGDIEAYAMVKTPLTKNEPYGVKWLFTEGEVYYCVKKSCFLVPFDFLSESNGGCSPPGLNGKSSVEISQSVPLKKLLTNKALVPPSP